MSDDSTVVIPDIQAALSSSELEASEKNAALIVVGGELNGTLFDLPPGEVLIGRNPECGVVLEFNGISRKHLRLNITEAGVTMSDLGSSNGSYLNNTKVTETTALRKNDIIKLGAIALKYLPKGNPERLTYEKLNNEANTDGLTGCFNKSYFNRSIDMEVKKSKVTGQPLTLIIFDLDHFKKLNDNFGHDAGDFVLKELSGLIKENGARKGDVFARYGGEEFVILLPITNLKQGFEIAERLRRLVEGHKFMYDGKRLPVTASIGVADYRQGVNTGTDLFKRADQAVYKAKEGGRNQVQFFKA